MMTVCYKGDDMATIRELIYGRPLPIKIRCADLSSEWVMVTHANEMACLTTDSNDNCNSWLLCSSNWELYEEPKKKVKIALYAFNDGGDRWQVSKYYYKEAKDFVQINDDCKFIRLDWSEIEVDED